MFTFALLHICYLKRAVLKLKASECLQTAASTTKGSIFVKKSNVSVMYLIIKKMGKLTVVHFNNLYFIKNSIGLYQIKESRNQ